MLGVLVSLLKILTKTVYPQDPDGLRKCVNLYFAVGIVVMVICDVSYNVAQGSSTTQRESRERFFD